MKRDLTRIGRNADNLLKKKENPSHADLNFNSAVKASLFDYILCAVLSHSFLFRLLFLGITEKLV